MKIFSLVFLLAALASAQTGPKNPISIGDPPGTGTQAVSAQEALEKLSTPTSSVVFTVPVSPCGMETWYPQPKLENGVCSVIFNFHYGPPEAQCRWVTNRKGTKLNLVCTWKPKKESK